MSYDNYTDYSTETPTEEQFTADFSDYEEPDTQPKTSDTPETDATLAKLHKDANKKLAETAQQSNQAVLAHSINQGAQTQEIQTAGRKLGLKIANIQSTITSTNEYLQESDQILNEIGDFNLESAIAISDKIQIPQLYSPKKKLLTGS